MSRKDKDIIMLPKSIKILFLLLFAVSANWAIAQSTSLTVISNPKGSPSTMEENEMKSIFLGEKQRWRSGDKIMIALMKTNTPIGKNVCDRIYNMSEDGMKKHWLALVFQGKAEAPSFFTSLNELQVFVSENPGAIGIIDQTPPASGLQIVLIDGNKSF